MIHCISVSHSMKSIQIVKFDIERLEEDDDRLIV